MADGEHDPRDVIIKIVGSGWTWFEDYAFVRADWKCAVTQNRRVQVGMGLFVFGEPRGEKIEVFGNEMEFTTWGAGAIHARVIDGQGDCYMGLTRNTGVLISLPPIKFP